MEVIKVYKNPEDVWAIRYAWMSLVLSDWLIFLADIFGSFVTEIFDHADMLIGHLELF